MAPPGAGADDNGVRVRRPLALLVGVSLVAVLVGASATATAGQSCAGSEGSGYAYAGHQSDTRGHGVRAKIELTRAPGVEAGHVAGWVGVGGPGQGPNGEDAWLQVGIASLPGLEPFIYAEVTREGREPEFTLIEEGVAVGRSHTFAVLEVAGREGWWKVWVDGQPVTKPLRLRGSSGRWAPIATAESWNGGASSCNDFGFRFERVSVAYGGGGAWRPFVSGYRFRDGAYTVRTIAKAPATADAYRHVQATDAVLPYAFAAAS
jgi:hypothetical protein